MRKVTKQLGRSGMIGREKAIYLRKMRDPFSTTVSSR